MTKDKMTLRSSFSLKAPCNSAAFLQPGEVSEFEYFLFLRSLSILALGTLPQKNRLLSGFQVFLSGGPK